MTVTTRRERRQQIRRQQRRAGGGAGGGRSRGFGQLWIALGVVVVVAVFILVGRAAGVFDAPRATPNIAGVDASGPTLGEHMPDLKNAHIPVGQQGNYTTLPPTSGDHYAQPAAPAPWGIKSTWLPFEVTTHNLEHGGIVILYRDLAPAEAQQLESVVRSLGASGYPKIVLEPYPDLQGGRIALTAWNWILKLQGVDEPSVVKFVRQHTDGEAPENGTP